LEWGAAVVVVVDEARVVLKVALAMASKGHSTSLGEEVGVVKAPSAITLRPRSDPIGRATKAALKWSKSRQEPTI